VLELTAGTDTYSIVIVTFILEADELNENLDIETSREGSLVPPWPAHEALHANNDIMAEERPAMQPLSQEGGEQLHPACASPQTSAQEQGFTLSLREASLMRCFIQKIAPWVRPGHFYPCKCVT
jgi:hypothetical protein